MRNDSDPFNMNDADSNIDAQPAGDLSQKKAVALLYDQVRAPVLKAKGQGALAQAIIDTAKRHGVHVAEDPVLAETLSYLQLEQEIPEEVYRAVATVLSWAYWMKGEAPQVLTDP